MRELYVPMGAFLPIDREVIIGFLDEYRAKLGAGEAMKPIPVVPLEDGVYDRDLIMVDGHHQLFVQHEIGRKTALALAYEHDAEIRKANYSVLATRNTIAQVRHAYLSNWKIKTERKGVHSIGDLKIVDIFGDPVGPQ